MIRRIRKHAEGSRRWRRVAAALLVAFFALAATPAPAQDGASPSGDAAPSDAVETATDALPGAVSLLIVISLFVVPMIVGTWLARRLRMPDHGWKFAVAIGTLSAAAVLVAPAFFEDYDSKDRDYVIKLGPDLSGGITLIYELAEETDDEALVDVASDPNVSESDLVDQLIAALSERVDPSGTKEVTIRKYGEGQIEIIIPRAKPQDVEMIKRKIYTAGALEFRITASPQFGKHRAAIELAQQLPPGRDIVKLGDTEVARWVEVDREQFDDVSWLVTRNSGDTLQALVMTDDGQDVTGELLKSASPGFDESGRPQVEFTFNSRGANKFGLLTGSHLPNRSGQKYNLGILLDGKLLSAPSIESKIRDRGRISGGNMSEEEVNFVVGILNAGHLPAALNKTPISDVEISPTIGAETVEKGKLAITTSLAAVVVFMLIYYRFAGFVACIALAANLLLILGALVLIKGALTLPGLAGLVLTVGMSVDANVLIFERIREELNRGAALRMAIRNGFARATQTIIDANVTTLITGVVIYKIAPDNVKGFGVTLILGILMSMYTAIFLSRIVFDVAERLQWLKSLSMSRIVGETHLNFLGKSMVAAVVSLVVIGVGLVGVQQRGEDLLNIDFTGGSSVMIVLDDDHRMEYSEVKSLLDETQLAEENISLVAVGETKNRYTVTTVNQDVDQVQQILKEAFGESLKTYRVDVDQVAPLPGGQATIRSFPQDATADAYLPEYDAAVTHVMFQDNSTTEQPEGEQEQTVEDSSAGEDGESGRSSEDGDSERADAEEPAETESAETDASDAEQASLLPEGTMRDPFAGGSTTTLTFGVESAGDSDAADDLEAADDGVSKETLEQLMRDSLQAADHEGIAFELSNPDYVEGSVRRFNQWTVKLALPPDEAQPVFEGLQSAINGQPVFPLANNIGGRVADRMQTDAIYAIAISLLGIIAYIWFRFQRVIYGLAAVVALIHDVLVTIGVVALSAWIVDAVPPLASALMIEKFQISLPLVAAFLTIIGYSLNDTIVVFDRIREVKGKSPRLTAEMINASINQTLSRTLLTSLTTLLTVVVLYVLGGDGIHAFAFALVIGVFVGTYSSVFVACPALLWMSNRAESSAANSPARAA